MCVQPDSPPPRASAWLLLAVAIGTLVALGFGARRHDFFVSDDFNALYGTQRARTLGEVMDIDGSFRLSLIRESIPDYTTKAVLLRPITALTLAFDHWRAGLAPHGYRDSACAMHALAALALAGLAYACTRRFFAAALAGCLFSLHPAHVEPLLWVSARADLLVGIGMALSLWAWQSYAHRGGGARLAITCALFFTSLFTKEMAVTLPGLALALWWLAPQPRRGSLGRGMIALTVTLLGYFAVRFALIGSIQTYHELHGALAILSSAARFVAEALTLASWPGDRLANPDPDALRLLSAAAGAGLLALAAAEPGFWRLAAGCLTAFVLSTVPVATWHDLSADGNGSRLIYPSLMLLVLLLATTAARIRPRRRLTTIALAATMLTANLLATWRASDPWQRAAAKSQKIVAELRTASAGAETLVLSNSLPARLGPAFLAQNALPCAAWLFIDRKLRMEWLYPAQWQSAVQEHRELLRTSTTLRALRWDDATETWLGPDLK